MSLSDSFSRTERLRLADTLAHVGPDAPTKCEGWTARDLAVHLVIREGRPDAAVSAYIPRVPGLSDHAEKVRQDYAQQPWSELLDTFRSGAPGWWPMSWPGLDRSNDLEFFVHHEDVRRAQPDWEPRSLAPEEEAALWSQLRLMAKLLYRRSPVSVVLRAEGGRETKPKSVTDAPAAVVSGPVGELVLHAFGRQDVARVEVTGDPSAVEALQTSRRGI